MRVKERERITHEKHIFMRCPDCGSGKLVVGEKDDELQNIRLYHENESRGKPKLKCPVCKHQIGFEVKNKYS